MTDPWILGYCSTHNGAVCLLRGDEIVAAVQEERLTGLKRARLGRLDESLAFRYCLDVAGIDPNDLDMIVGAYFSGDPQTGLEVVRQGWRGQFLTVPHHYAHAVGVFALSGFDDATVLVVDGQGGLADFLPESELVNVKRAEVPSLRRWAEIISIYHVDDAEVRCLEKHLGEWMPDMQHLRPGQPMQTFGSLGGMYSSAAHQIFGDAMEAGKVMGLAAYGEREFSTEDFFTIGEDGEFRFKATVPARYASVGQWPGNQRENQNLATSVQHALEDGIHHLVDHAQRLGSSNNLCYVGGVALNAITNEQIIRKRYFDDVYIMAAAEDSGTAIGAAYHGLRQFERAPRKHRVQNDAVGRQYDAASIERAIAETPYIEEVRADDPVDKVADLLEKGYIVGWFQGGSEIGPRALGQRSILSDARSPDAKTRLNARVKHREPFRPFAPLVLQEEAANWFDVPDVAPTSPLMLRTFAFLEGTKDQVPATVHADGTGRLQTVSAETNPGLYELLKRFFDKTGVPIIVNTSFNVMGEPIVETPEDALWCLLYTDLDYCFLEGRLVRRASGFESILQLYPRLVATGYEIESPIAGGRFELNFTPGTMFRMKVDTPWGVSKPYVPQIALPILQMADGSRTAQAILRELQPSTQVDEITFKTIIRHLRRAHVLNLTEQPEKGATDP